MARSSSYSDQGTGKTLVFQHGLGANRKQIQSLLDPLSGVRLITTDMPGHGTCQLDPDLPPSFKGYTDEILRIMDQAGIYRAVVGGLSMGSGIAVQLACRYPDRVAALVLLRPAWLMESKPPNLRILHQVADHAENGGQRTFESVPEFRRISRENPEAATSIMGMFSRDQPESTPTILRAMVNDQPCPSAEPPLITLPALVIGNDHDPLHPWRMAEAWHEMLPNSQLIKVPSRYRQPEAHKHEVNAAIQKFIHQITIN